MVSAITSTSSNVQNSISDQIGIAVDQIGDLLDAIKKALAKNTTKETSILLIEYILANMSGDKEGAKSIGDQIGTVMKSYSDNLQKADTLEGQVTALKNDPGAQTTNILNYLDNLIDTLQKDVASGDLSNVQIPS